MPAPCPARRRSARTCAAGVTTSPAPPAPRSRRPARQHTARERRRRTDDRDWRRFGLQSARARRASWPCWRWLAGSRVRHEVTSVGALRHERARTRQFTGPNSFTGRNTRAASATLVQTHEPDARNSLPKGDLPKSRTTSCCLKCDPLHYPPNAGRWPWTAAKFAGRSLPSADPPRMQGSVAWSRSRGPRCCALLQ